MSWLTRKLYEYEFPLKIIIISLLFSYFFLALPLYMRATNPQVKYFNNDLIRALRGGKLFTETELKFLELIPLFNFISFILFLILLFPYFVRFKIICPDCLSIFPFSCYPEKIEKEEIETEQTTESSGRNSYVKHLNKYKVTYYLTQCQCKKCYYTLNLWKTKRKLIDKSFLGQYFEEDVF